MSTESTSEEWGVRLPWGDVEPAGILGEDRARRLVTRYQLRMGGCPAVVVKRVGDGSWVPA